MDMSDKTIQPERFIPVAEPVMGGNELAYITDCVASGWVSSLGSYISRFEQTFASFCGVKHGVSTSNGTAALHLAMASLDIGPGDEVIIPSLTFIATANAVRYLGANPVFVDSSPRTWNLSPESMAKTITTRTRAVIPVHLYGHPADMDAINALAKKHGMIVIEDAAEAHGAEYRGQRTGSLGRAAAFSFYGNKVVTTGEGGMITTDDDGLAERAISLRDHGMSRERRYWHPVIGYNYRLTNMQAALGVAQMERIDEMLARKRAIAALYSELLGGTPGVGLPVEEPWARNIYWMYSILVSGDFGISRDELMVRLKARQIDTRPFFNPIHLMPPYATGQSLPVAERLARQGLSLPSSTALTDADVQRIASAIRQART